MSQGILRPLARMDDLARRVLEELAPACERIEIAGSIRRSVPSVRDVELVAIPRCHANLLGDPDEGSNELDQVVDRLITDGRLVPRRPRRMGQRFKALATAGGIPVDLFAVLPPATWGVIHAIRTGPSKFSKALVTVARSRGMCVEGGRLLQGLKTIDTPTESAFFRALGLPHVAPSCRTDERAEDLLRTCERDPAAVRKRGSK